MLIVQHLDDVDLTEFTKIAAEFGQDRFGYVVTPNVDHLIRYHDDPRFRATYADAAYVLLDSRFLAYLLALTAAIRPKVCTGSDLTARLFAEVIHPEDRVVLIGGTAEQARQLRSRYGLRDLEQFSPPMGFIANADAVEECLEYVESKSPFRFCLLAVGSPQQELIAQMLKVRGRARPRALRRRGGQFHHRHGAARAALDAGSRSRVAVSPEPRSGPPGAALSGARSARVLAARPNENRAAPRRLTTV